MIKTPFNAAAQQPGQAPTLISRLNPAQVPTRPPGAPTPYPRGATVLQPAALRTIDLSRYLD